jgi:hypothetical protein
VAFAFARQIHVGPEKQGALFRLSRAAAGGCHIQLRFRLITSFDCRVAAMEQGHTLSFKSEECFLSPKRVVTFDEVLATTNDGNQPWAKTGRTCRLIN